MGGATGEECFALVKEMTEAKREKEAKTARNKAARAEAKKTRVAATNDLGAQVAGKIKSNADIGSASSRWTSSSRRCPSRVWPAPTR